MGVFDSLERKLEGVVSGGFARAFKGEVREDEIQARLERELDAEARLLSGDRKLVPNDFTIALSDNDFDALFPDSAELSKRLASSLRKYASTAGYLFNGPITIEFLQDAGLPTGRFTVASESIAAVESQAASAPTQRTASLVLEVNGVRHPLTPPGFTIGRGADADIRINDPGISRQHARISVTPGPDGLAMSIDDMGSTNGIIVNGERVRHAKLSEGTRIEMGNTRLLVRTPVRDV